MGSSLAIFFLINNCRMVHIKCTQRREANQQFSKNSKLKLLTPGKIENHFIVRNFEFKGRYFEAGRIEFEAVCRGGGEV